MKLEHPLMNAAGTVKTVEQALKLAKAPVAALVMGSYTPDARAGNAGQTYHSAAGFALNALGLPNPGIAYFAEHAQAVKDALGDRPLIVSLAGFCLDDYLEMIAQLPPFVEIEINLGCPNVFAYNKRIASFTPSLIERVLSLAKRPVGLKLSPYSDPYQLENTAFIVESASFLTLSNTFPNGWYPDALSTPYGGVSGAAMKPIVLGQIRQFRSFLPGMQIIAAGGFRQSHDWQDYEAAGADAVQIASRFLDGNEDPDVFVTLLTDLA